MYNDLGENCLHIYTYIHTYIHTYIYIYIYKKLSKESPTPKPISLIKDFFLGICSFFLSCRHFLQPLPSLPLPLLPLPFPLTFHCRSCCLLPLPLLSLPEVAEEWKQEQIITQVSISSVVK